jgi:predicted kinase
MVALPTSWTAAMTFDQYLAHFKTTSLWAKMASTVEASPWHREASVAVHAEMTLDEHACLSHIDPSSERYRLCQIALLMHDIGKPAAEETLEKKDGSGTYRRYAGHELLSANYFMQQCLLDEKLRELLEPLGGVEAARKIKWLIEHHLPFSMKDTTKREQLYQATVRTLGDVNTLFDHLRADCHGRISDDHDTKKQAVEDWITSFAALEPTCRWQVPVNELRGYLLLGPSASGKTTWANKKRAELGGGITLSLDDLRLEYVFGTTMPAGDPKEAYAKAWKLCSEQEGTFNAFVQQALKARMQTAKTNKLPVFVDTAISSVRKRAQFVQLLRAHGYHITAVEFWNPLDVVLDRQYARPDKQVPAGSVVKQWENATCAWLGRECDAVEVVAG